MELDLRSLPDKPLLTAYQSKYPHIDVEAVQLFLRFQQVNREIQKNYDALFQHFHLTEAKFTILMLIYRQQEHQILPSKLASMLGVKKPTITGIVNGLVKAGLVIKLANQKDKRATFIALTKQGLSLLETFLPTNYTTANTIMGNLTEEERATFHILLEKIAEGNANLSSQQINEAEEKENE
ncbi:MarR family winged helix-turn-helix transcriptional regulator [Isobaculum melis]|uniref:DNA-binding transcriptional regulator, MarR family n=1 Tax=Isobaculum melis TaxID=142588 RepID=A0A1H9UGH6_9LACT|nr:MarR family transcriptional regulator [Isobaculum melis]SES08546.1 DNA-binding transcriptional regulator, MarR family [Isobaculum melis]